MPNPKNTPYFRIVIQKIYHKFWISKVFDLFLPCKTKGEKYDSSYIATAYRGKLV